MSDVWNLEAFQLTRGLLGGVCAALPKEADALGLHRAAARATSQLAGSGTAPDPIRRAASLAAARASLAELDELLRLAEQQGQLPPELATALEARRAAAAEALDQLSSLTAAAAAVASS